MFAVTPFLVRYYAVFRDGTPFFKSVSVPWTDAVFATVQIGFQAQCWSCFSGLDVGRSEPAGVFHIQPAKRTLRMSTFVLLVAEIALPMCDKMIWLALFTERRKSGAWTSPLLPAGVPSVTDVISDHIGKNSAGNDISLSVTTIVSTA